ncbi:hypothetical protein ANN_14810 [Periplaneta americana]|uniref:Uncharacterized protein n=1 Tax=Periplaneta americana TaxID=6978 RepID=A0ABQ8SYX4_PERAM|nr:hypothetical protein ANN_14810 [Periplaneta americana]
MHDKGCEILLYLESGLSDGGLGVGNTHESEVTIVTPGRDQSRASDQPLLYADDGGWFEGAAPNHQQQHSSTANTPVTHESMCWLNVKMADRITVQEKLRLPPAMKSGDLLCRCRAWARATLDPKTIKNCHANHRICGGYS